MNRKLEGIEPIIAVVILVAVTLVLAIAVVGWIMGWWGATAGPTESLKITPIKATANETGKGVIELYVCNTGTAKATIKSVIVSDIGQGNITNGTAVDPGKCETVKVEITEGLEPGRAYEVIVSTAAGNSYKTVVRAE